MKREPLSPEIAASPQRLSSIPPQTEPELEPRPDPERFAVIDGRRLERECFFRSVRLLYPRVILIGHDTVESCLGSLLLSPCLNAIMLRVDQNTVSDPDVRGSIRRLVNEGAPVPVVALSDTEDLGAMAVLDYGISGCIPARIGLEGIVAAMKLASSGSFLLTSHGLNTLRRAIEKEAQAPKPFADGLTADGLTARQAAVAEALRRGKANKVIAYELHMCENTVKVHVRNILKKLQVTNRTEAAFKLNAMLGA